MADSATRTVDNRPIAALQPSLRIGGTTALGAATLLIVALASPLLFGAATFDVDWQMHLWYLWHQSLAIQANGMPSLFVHYFHSVFYPEYAFYGGGLYAMAGAFSLALGNAPLQTYVLTYCVAFAAAYGGWLWMARMAGVKGWLGHVPGGVFITSASYLTILYGRGDWQEFIGVSAIPLLAAAGISVLRSERLRFWPALALAGGATTFFAGHNMTMLWGSTFLAITGATTLVCVPEARRQIRRRGAICAMGLLTGAALVNAWFLLPSLAYESHTLIGSGYRYGSRYWNEILVKYMPAVAAGHLFALSRTAGTGVEETNRVFALPVLAMAWTVVSAALLLRAGSKGAWMRALAVLAAVAAVFGIVMTHASLISALPRPYTILQFSYRVESYVLLGICGALLAALALTSRSSDGAAKLWKWALVPVLLATAIGVFQQLDALPSRGDRERILSSSQRPTPVGAQTPLALEDYLDVAVPPLVSTERAPERVYFPPNLVHGDRLTMVVHARVGALVASNVGGGPELVGVTGAKIVGVDSEGNDVLQIEGPSQRGQTQKDDPKQANRRPSETITLAAATDIPVTLGRWLSIVGAAALGLWLAGLAIASVRRARSFRRGDDRRSFPDRDGDRRAGSSQMSSRS